MTLLIVSETIELGTIVHYSVVFDHDLIDRFRLRAFKKSIKDADFLASALSEDLEKRLATIKHSFDHGIDLHGYTGFAAKIMSRSGKVKKIERIETLVEFLTPEYPSKLCSRELLDLKPQHADLIVSLSSLHMTNNLPSVIKQIRRGLKADGLFLAVTCGHGTLKELQDSFLQAESELYGGTTPRVIPFLNIQEVGLLLQQASFALPVIDIEKCVVRYDSVFNLFADLRAMGMQNAQVHRSRNPVSRRFFTRVAEIYAHRFSDSDGRIRATFSFIWMSGWVPHPMQQKPMKPGTAELSLVQVL